MVKKGLRSAGVSFEDEELSRMVGQLSAEGLVRFTSLQSDRAFLRYLSDYSRLAWLYVLILLSFFEALLVIVAPQEVVASLSRQILGLALLGFMPGYALTSIMFPGDDLSLLERILLSIFLSVVVSTSEGLVLGSVLLFRPLYITISLAGFTVLSCLIAGHRSFSYDRKAGGLLSPVRAT
jgi:uncharacterized membrane protein